MGFGYGVVFKVDAAGHETVLHSFTGGADGGNPYAGVIRDSAGNLYGTANGGGARARAWCSSSIRPASIRCCTPSRAGPMAATPTEGVIRDSAGNLYGTTNGGGASNAGVVFKMDTSGNETVLYSFTGGADGGNPLAGVIRDSAGNLYGTTNGGGARARAWCSSWTRPATRRCCTASRAGPMAASPGWC